MFGTKTHHHHPQATPAQHAIYPTSKLKAYVALLIASKGMVCLCYFLSYDILRSVHVVYFLFVAKSIASILLVLIQRPFSSGKRLGRHLWLRIVRHALVGTLLCVVQLFGLTLCGPIRTVLLLENTDVIVIAAAMALFTGSGGNSKLRGAVCFLVGILCLVLFDHDEIVPSPTEEQQPHHAGVGHLFYYSVSWPGLDHKAGVVMLVSSLCLQAGYSSASRRLAVDVGGAKRLNSLSTLVSSLLLAPLAFFLRLSQTTTPFQWRNLTLPFVAIAVFMFVTNYYVDTLCATKLDSTTNARVASLASFTLAISAGALPLLQQIDKRHDLSLGVILAWCFFVFATMILTSSNGKKSTRGTFVGYSAAGLPLYTLNGEASVDRNTGHGTMMVIRNGLRQILEESDSRKIFYFLCLNMVFTVVEWVTGIWTNSLGLISDGFHMLFDCSALIMGLCASLLARKKPTKTFPFGHGRVEILSGFVNGLFLVVVAIIVFKAALGRLVDPPKVLTTRLLTVSVAGLLVNLLGIFVFHHAHHHQHGGSSHQHSHGGGNANLQGVFLHILADTLGSVGVIFSSLMIKMYGLYIADPVCSLFISFLILASVLPLLKQTAGVLLLRTPDGLEKSLAVALNKVMQVPGVLSYREPRFWQHSSQVSAGSIHVQVAPSASEQKTTNQVSAVFRELGFVHFSVQVEKEAFFQHLCGLGNDLNNMLRSAQSQSIKDGIKNV